MATVVNTFPDRRAELLGKGLGTIIGNVITARRKKEEETRKKAALQEATKLLSQAAKGSEVDPGAITGALFEGGATSESILAANRFVAQARIARRQREEDAAAKLEEERRAALGLIAKEERGESRTIRKEGRGEQRDIRGEGRGEQRDIRGEGRGEGRDIRGEGRQVSRENQLLADTLKRSAEEEAAKNIDDRLTGLAFERVLKGAPGLSPAQVTNVIADAAGRGDFTPDQIFSLLDRVDSLAAPGAEDDFVKIPAFDIDSGRKVDILVPPEIATGGKDVQDLYLKSKGFNVTTQPRALVTGEERLFNQLVENIGGADDPYVKQLASLKRLGLISVRTDAAGNTTITDLKSGKNTFIVSGQMDAVAARQIQFKISSIEDALTSLEEIDLTKVGMDDFLTAKLAGAAMTAPLGVGWAMRGILDFLGLEPTEVAEAQAARASFFATLAPIAKSIATEEGERNAISSPAAIELAKDIILITNPTTTEIGARIAVKRLQGMLRKLKVQLMAQLSHRSNIRPIITDIDIRLDDSGRYRLEKRKEE